MDGFSTTPWRDRRPLTGRCLITGGAGFLGRRTAELLSEAGAEVSLVDVRPVSGGRWSVLPIDISSATDVFTIIGEIRPDYVVHLASLLPPESEARWARSEMVIVGGFVSLLEAARAFSVRRVVWASATSVFGDPVHHGGLDVEVPNDAPHYPSTIYGICKSSCERIAELYYKRYTLDTLGLRFAQGYGPGKERGRAFGYELFEAVAARIPYRVPFGNDLINWQYLDDMAELIVRALHVQPTQTRVFNTSGEVLTMKETVALLEELAPGCELQVEPGVTGLAWRYDTSELEREFGRVRITSARDGFTKTLDALRREEVRPRSVAV